MNSTAYDPFYGLKKGDRILLAFSGGIDSAIAAHLCKKAGLDVLSANMRFLPGAEQESPKVQAAADALGIELHFLDLQDEFRENVMHRCWDVFNSGKTPNPCVICNPVFKFGRLMDFAVQNGCAAMATGHYARLQRDAVTGRPVLARGVHRAKDQSYFLYGLSEAQLAFARFPLGAMTKDEVRAIGDELGLPNAKAKESQDACFTPETGTLAEMLQREFCGAIRKGCFIHAETGKILGAHKGIHAYTIGQRKGTGVALGTPAYIQKIDAKHAAVYITADENTLLCDHLKTEPVHWQGTPETEPFRALVQVRYRSPAMPALIQPQADGCCAVQFDEPIRAITPGQSVVFYGEETVLGGGVIAE